MLRCALRREDRPDGPLPHTPRVAAVIEATSRDAAELGHDYVGTEHLLLALYAEPLAASAAGSAYRTGGGLAAVVLTELGLDRDTARARIIEELSGYRAP